jgi:hypothetical protein
MSPGWWEGGRTSRGSTIELTPRFALTHSKHGDKQNTPWTVQGEVHTAQASLSWPRSHPPHWLVCWWEATDNAKQSTSPCQDHHRTRIDRQTHQIYYFEREGKKWSRRNPNRQGEGEWTFLLFSAGQWLSILQSQDFLQWFSFFLLVSSLEFQHSFSIVHSFSSNIKSKPTHRGLGGEWAQYSLKRNLRLFW